MGERRNQGHSWALGLDGSASKWEQLCLKGLFLPGASLSGSLA